MKPYCFTLLNDDGEETQHSLPSKWEICDGCHGNGVHDHPAFSNGLSQEDFDEDPDFRGDYMSGKYDVNCQECSGSGKVLSVNEEALTPNQKEVLELHYNELASNARERRSDAYTRMMENGGY